MAKRLTVTVDVPESLEAEQSTLGAMLMEASARDAAMQIVESDDFYRSFNRKVFDALTALHLANEKIDPQTLLYELKKRGHDQEVGGAAYVMACIESCPSAANVRAYADEVRRLADDRRRVLSIERALRDSRDVAVGPETASRRALDELTRIDERARLVRELPYSTDEALDGLLGDIEWLWPGWIVRGAVSCVVGRPGAGKTFLCMELCRILRMSESLPDRTRPDERDVKKPFLWIDTEFSLMGMGERMQIMGIPRGTFLLPLDPLQLLQLDKASDMAWVAGMIARHRPPLVVVDSLSGAHSGEERSNDQMKTLMQQLSRLAQAHKVAVVCIHHLRKKSEMEPDWPLTLDMVRGASAITQFSRSIIGLGAPDVNDPHLLRMEIIKSSFGMKPPALGYQITGEGVAWGAAPEKPRASSPLEAARHWLMNTLHGGPQAADEMERDFEAGSHAFSWRTVQTARRDVGVIATKSLNRWFWSLPGEAASQEAA